MENVTSFKAALTAAITALTALWGWLGWLLVAWIAAMVLDYITGSAAAVKAGTWSSKVARDGIWHKAGAISVVLISGLLDLVLGSMLESAPFELPFEYTILLCPLVCVWYILTEAGSIVENAGKLGANVPTWLAKHIASMQDAVDASGGQDKEKVGKTEYDPDAYLQRDLAGKEREKNDGV